MKQRKFLIVCGGTGGHVFPALAIADGLKKQGIEHIVFAGRADSMEQRLVSPHWDYELISAVPLHRGSFLNNLSLPYKLMKSIHSAKEVLNKVKPDVVIATGGYVSLPVVYAAAGKKIPIYLQEQNAVAGIANKIGARYAKHVFVTSKEAASFFKDNRVTILGNPVRTLPEKSKLVCPPEFSEGKKNVLVVGGSQGAQGINVKIEASLDRIVARDDINVVWQVGAKNYDDIVSRVPEQKNIFIKGFLNDIYAYMAYADLIISRAGASTLAEILAMGKPSILFPYPYATANHQEHNARAVEEAGACLVELDSDPNDLWNKVETLFAGGDQLSKMAAAAEKLGMPDAADRIAKIIIQAECE
ncbi:MAG: undecaprenyldiphospho-muramoylpentapeptide beta-N-acetylglucosaminyltransferase [Fibrobacter sp.]|jgi:UDP-N-acetylglucosamine--N-acetylmuramyl-(pentapeptide) pyrophosphoryl-undecaprenol N-acetylglucosamine transferase|nr:undecaprenyldiphospho-muramoylpentapeptide beta-N-acetylglucosaminyltransferase [Fibrobacter sp.]